jgi:hypothetical protein
MKTISVQQPWAQLIADRRRKVLIKSAPVEPGRYAIHASHVCNAPKAAEFGYDPAKLPKNAILALVEVLTSVPRLSARPSKFDTLSAAAIAYGKDQFAIRVKLIRKLRKPISVTPPPTHAPVWDCPLLEWKDEWEKKTSLAGNG